MSYICRPKDTKLLHGSLNTHVYKKNLQDIPLTFHFFDFIVILALLVIVRRSYEMHFDPESYRSLGQLHQKFYTDYYLIKLF